MYFCDTWHSWVSFKFCTKIWVKTVSVSNVQKSWYVPNLCHKKHQELTSVDTHSIYELFRSSGPVSYGYSELENNNSQCIGIEGDMSLQTPNVEYSSTSIKKEIVVRILFLFSLKCDNFEAKISVQNRNSDFVTGYLKPQNKMD